jgi:Flp pilus assembly protein TadG
VELAVVFPILLLLIIGVADYGRVFFTSITVANAARAGAEFGTRNAGAVTDTAAMNAFAQADGNEVGTIDFTTRTYCQCGSAAQACTSFCTGGVAPDVFVEVIASKTVRTLLKYPGLPDSVNIRRKAVFRTQ